MNPAEVMQEIGARLDTIEPLTCYGFPPDHVNVPAAIMVAPDSITFDATYGRGSDEMTLPVLLLIARIDDKSAWSEIAAYCSGAGSKSFKQVIESRNGSWVTFDLVRVSDIIFDVVKWNNTDYLSAKFNLEIDGPGST